MLDAGRVESKLMPLVSVVIPTRNRPQIVLRAIASVLRQTRYGGSVAACAGLVVLLPKVREPDRRRIAETAETEAHR